MRGVALILTLALAAFSGCVEPIEDAGDVAPLAEEAAQALDEVAEAPGHLAGVVVDAGGQPIEGATATLDGLDVVRTADADGSFAFLDLAAGAKVLRVVADGFEAQAVDVGVLPGQVTRASVALAAIPPAPRYEVLTFEGYADMDAGGLTLLCDCSFSFETGPGLKQAILEAVVDEGSFSANDGAWYDFSIYGEGNGTGVSDYGSSSLRDELPVDFEAEAGYLYLQPESAVLAPEFGRHFTAYVTLVYDALAEDGYTAIPAEE